MSENVLEDSKNINKKTKFIRNKRDIILGVIIVFSLFLNLVIGFGFYNLNQQKDANAAAIQNNTNPTIISKKGVDFTTNYDGICSKTNPPVCNGTLAWQLVDKSGNSISDTTLYKEDGKFVLYINLYDKVPLSTPKIHSGNYTGDLGILTVLGENNGIDVFTSCSPNPVTNCKNPSGSAVKLSSSTTLDGCLNGATNSPKCDQCPNGGSLQKDGTGGQSCLYYGCRNPPPASNCKISGETNAIPPICFYECGSSSTSSLSFPTLCKDGTGSNCLPSPTSSSSSSQTTSNSQSSSQSSAFIQPPVSTPLYLTIPENSITFSPDRAKSVKRGSQDLKITFSNLTYLDSKYKCSLSYKPYPSSSNPNPNYTTLETVSKDQNGQFAFNFKKELQTSSVIIINIQCADFSRTGGDFLNYVYFYEGNSTYNYRVGALSQVEIGFSTN